MRVGRICLVTKEPQALLDFYRDRLGLDLLGREGEATRLGSGGRELIRLEQRPEARPAGRWAGLFHLALRLPQRRDLAGRLRRLTDARTPLEGMADHGVSEAIYLSDPDGNGIELYHDRPRETWFAADGSLQMGTWPLDVNDLLPDLPEEGSGSGSLPAGTELGHIHLRVQDIGASEEFYTRALGLTLMARLGTRAGFVSAGGYHHHIGFNTWGGPFEPVPEAPVMGMGWFSLLFPDHLALQAVVERLKARRVPFERAEGEILVRDPSNILIRLAVGGDPGRPNDHPRE